MRERDGGPAFPRPASTDEHGSPCNVYQDQDGMTLRDWLAGQALAGNLANPKSTGEPENEAKWAYKHADAMLAERAKRDD